jgi:glycosyltransferase involved in cell wall biosynthesis
MPLFSVVTPCLNAEAYIDEAIRSVLAQKCADIEHIVVDGGSTDETLTVLSRYPHLRVIQERDNGLYEALNRGIGVAQGAFIGHLNADDCYIAGAFDRVLGAIREFPGAEIISGSAIVGRSGLDLPGTGERLESKPLDIDSITFGVPAINARFMARSLYERIGLYDIGYSRAADREFLLRAVLAGVRNVQIPESLYWYRSHTGSLTIGGNRRKYLSVGREHMDIARQYLANEQLQESGKAVMRRWHSEGATLDLTDALLAGRLGQGLKTIGQALKVDALALPRMLKFGAEKLVRMVRAGQRRGT